LRRQWNRDYRVSRTVCRAVHRKRYDTGTFINPGFESICTADPDGWIAESNEGNNNCSDTVTVIAAVGSDVTYLVTIVNAGPNTAINVQRGRDE